VTSIDQVIERLRARNAPELYPTQPWDASLSRLLLDSSVETLFESENMKDLDATVRAGLLLWNDDLSASHTISQGIETPDGSFWHAIMHRREADHSNSKYWYHNAGEHSVFPKLREFTTTKCGTDEAGRAFCQSLGRLGEWDYSHYVDACAAVRNGDAAHQSLLKQIQLQEIELLLAYCRQKALGWAGSD